MDDIEVQVKIRDVNPHIVCSLCAGYFVEATTVTECLHTFCKSCIVKYLQSSKCCPTCNLQIHETQPLLNLQLDRTMQDVVHKVVPGIEEDEERRKREFYDLRGLPVERPAMLIHALEQDHGEKPQHIKRDFSEHKNSYRDDELVSLCIERYGSDEDEENSDHDNSMEGDSKNHPVCKTLSKKYLRCSVRMRILNLQRYLNTKLKLPVTQKVEVLCNNHVILPCRTMKFVWITEWIDKEAPMVLQYRITEYS
ncbi:polycomb group RING finger protein 1 isoform X2 [Nematostella vectensis]|uniref:polycomb group RING finger protein 1 isoform X2 n=1 Tax=Nematostella vectensis TaxID=45351 RepID=UPI00207760E2|nr:polycomb group RING finger protein 1 isoform X2 [Nematostella vectensis]